MENEIYSIFHMSIEPAAFETFKALVDEIVERTRREADTLTYQYVVSDDRRSAHIIEHYRMPGVLPHIEQTFAPYAERFLALAKIEKLFVYGNPTPDIRAKLDGFGAVYLSPFSGFRR